MRRHELSNESQYSPGPQAGRASGARAGGHGSAAPGVLRQRMHDFTTESQYSPDPQAGRLSSAIDSGVRQRDFLESHCSPSGHAPGPAFGEGGLCAICACDPHANRPSELVSPMTMALTSLNALSPYGSHRTCRPPAHAVRRARLARNVLHERDGALGDQRHRHRLGAHAVARGSGAWKRTDFLSFVCG